MISHQSWFTVARPSTPSSAHLEFGREHGGKFLRRDSSNDCKPQGKSCHSGITTEVWCVGTGSRFSIPVPGTLHQNGEFLCCDFLSHSYTGFNSIPHYPTQAELTGSASFLFARICVVTKILANRGCRNDAVTVKT